MATIHKSLTVQAPAAKIFSYVNNPVNLPEFWPSVIEVKDITKLPNGGNSFGWVYKMAGRRFEGTSEDTEYVENERTVTESKGGINSTITFTYEPEEGGTKVTIHTEYTVPIPLIGKIAESFILKQNEQETETLLVNLKARMEA